MQADDGPADFGASVPSEPSSPESTGAEAISVVIPVLNGEHLAGPASDALTRALEGIGRPFELVFVDDGSTDATWPVLQGLAAADPRVRAVRLAANVGQAPAIAMGIAACRGGVIITTDVDLETDAADLPLLVAAIDRGHKVVSGRRTSPRRWEREIPSRAFNAYARARGIALNDIGCGTNAMRREAALAYAAVPDIRRELPTAILDQVAGGIVEVGMRSRRPATSQISARQLVMLWVAFERRRGRPKTTTAVLAGAGVTAVAIGSLIPIRTVRRPLGTAGLAITVLALTWRWLDGGLDASSTRTPEVVETAGSDAPDLMRRP